MFTLIILLQIMDSLLSAFPLDITATGGIDYITIIEVLNGAFAVTESITLPDNFKTIYVIGPLQHTGGGIIAIPVPSAVKLVDKQTEYISSSFISTQYENIILNSATCTVSRPSAYIFSYTNLRLDGFTVSVYRSAKYMLFCQK